METLKIGILYLGLHNQLIKKYGVEGTISRKDFFCKLGKHGQIPHEIRPLVLREMEDKELIKRISRDSIKLLSCNINIETDQKKLYKLAGVY